MVRSTTKWLLLALVGGTLQAVQAQDDPLARLAWLGGCWAAVGAEAGSGEQWLPLAGGTLIGVGRTVRGGRTVDFEFLQIRAATDGRIAYIAQPGGRPPTQFLSTTVSEREVVFENPQHDFPQRVIYRRGEGGTLRARIEGLRNGTMKEIDFPLQRVACESAGLPR